MHEAEVIHNRAMELADDADLAKRKGDLERARALYQQAYEQERQSLALVEAGSASVQTRAVMLLSAASLGYDAHAPHDTAALREVERLLARGLLLDAAPYFLTGMRQMLARVHAALDVPAMEG